MSEDFSFACLDYYDPDEYDTETFEGMIDTLNWFDTVGELRSLLRWLPDDLPVFVCDLYGWFHTPDDYSYISVFGDELNDYYEEAQNEL